MSYKNNLINYWYTINNNHNSALFKYSTTIKNNLRKFLFILLMIVSFDYLLLPWSVMAQVNDQPIEEYEEYTYLGYLDDLNLLGNDTILKMPETKDDLTYLSMPETSDLIDINDLNSFAKNNTINNLPKNSNLNTSLAGHFVLTAYNSEVGQCDDSPCITANGFNVCTHGIEDTVATNVLPFGTKVKIPDLFGERIFIVRDRMNRRYVNRLDVWMKEKTDAKKFGVRVAKIEILSTK